MLTRELTVTQELTKVKEKDIKDFEVTAYVLKDQVLFSQGKWKDYFYDEPNFNDAFEKTDWNNTQVTSLFLDHYDGTPDSVAGFIRGGAATWVGDVKNIHKAGKDLIGDLYIVDLDTANKIAYPGSQWGISAKLDVDFDEKNKGVKQYLYKNFSIVVEPAVKTAYINNTEADDRFAQFVKKIAKEVLITMADEKEEVSEEKTEEAKEEPSEPVKEEQPTEEPKEEVKEEPKEEEPKEELSEENLSELEKAAKLVLEFVSKHKVEHQEEEEKPEPEEESKEEPEEKQEEKKEEEPEPEKVENKDTKKDELVKTVEQLSADINKLKEKKTDNSHEVENVTTVTDGGICFKSETDLEFCNYLKNMIKED